ncbi:MAG TPA: hypothetical protein VFM05_13045, partial [Candidatus Saccharimonadales bacterium]|nr:hypothetical protein [Candidatus Saccharimonadales bacterium]
MKKLLVILVLVVVAVVVVTRSKDARPQVTKSEPIADRSSQPALVHSHDSHMDYAAKGRVPAYYETAPNPKTLPSTLSPDMFTGNKKLAYQVAKEIPQTLAQLPCYCHCDRGH